MNNILKIFKVVFMAENILDIEGQLHACQCTGVEWWDSTQNCRVDHHVVGTDVSRWSESFLRLASIIVGYRVDDGRLIGLSMQVNKM